MNQTVPAPMPQARGTRFWAIVCALLFAPAALVAGLLTLASERASRCVTYGEQCGTWLPGSLLSWGLGFGAVACLVALAAPAAVVRRWALAAQVLAEGVALLAILSHA
ncbi:hypothetical protein HUT19_02500 [Streptomyces sp. NA02950]|uniref:hypothetical protein n=1 Tax=Streptomyces sp. NA02950 TaxID=2742137 RepID=UPI00158FC728|nr:hypothetical protein [Streptomyces sp. NA02950]QKV90754.1 hypothetical protein HUT19_02500 [Streptomyces sp. NA02950]